jgi:hypothetical protein
MSKKSDKSIPEPAEPTITPAESSIDADYAAVKKGRATPTRKAQEAKNQRGLVIDANAGNKERKAKVRAERETQYQAMRNGDERNMPPEHRGPERRFLRDYVDARTSLGEFLLPLSIVFVIGSLFLNTLQIGGAIILIFYVFVLAAAVDTFLMTRRLKKHFIAKFGEGKLPRGWGFYVISRHFNLRRFRVPRPKVKRKEFPV